LDLTVQLTAIRDDPLFLQCSCDYTFMNDGLLLKPSFCMAAMIDTFFLSGTFQMKIGYICPCLTPKDELLFAVPTLRDWILSAVFGAFGVLGHPFIALRLC